MLSSKVVNRSTLPAVKLLMEAPARVRLLVRRLEDLPPRHLPLLEHERIAIDPDAVALRGRRLLVPLSELLDFDLVDFDLLFAMRTHEFTLSLRWSARGGAAPSFACSA
jgi:hypothetical protein